MNYKLTLLLCVIAVQQSFCTEVLNVEIKAQQSAPMRIFMGLFGDNSAIIEEVARTVQHDLMFEGNFDVVWDYVAAERTSTEMDNLVDQNYPLALFMHYVPRKKLRGVDTACIEWYLYDTYQHSMLGGKRHMLHGKVARGWGHEIAEQLSELLFGVKIGFASRIAYCKNVHIPGKRSVRHICIADMVDFNESNEVVVSRPTLNIAPRWNRDFARPLLFYSEGTDKNFRLVVNDLQGHSWIASNLDGINMQPTFSADGTWVVFCASRGAGSSQLYSYTKGKLQRLTHHDGNSLAPTMSADGLRIYFCSDHESKTPAIYCYSVSTGNSTRITRGGMAFSPHYCDANNQLVYTQAIQGVYQLCIYDEMTQQHRQVTFDHENKEECSWSPCGTYLVYCAMNRGKGRVCLFNVATGKKRYLTSADQDCSYPIWSPSYAYYPSLVTQKK